MGGVPGPAREPGRGEGNEMIIDLWDVGAFVVVLVVVDTVLRWRRRRLMDGLASTVKELQAKLIKLNYGQPRGEVILDYGDVIVDPRLGLVVTNLEDGLGQDWGRAYCRVQDIFDDSRMVGFPAPCDEPNPPEPMRWINGWRTATREEWIHLRSKIGAAH